MNTSHVGTFIIVLTLAVTAQVVGAADFPVDKIVVDGKTRVQALNDYTYLTRDAIQRAWKTPLELDQGRPIKGRIRIDYVVKRSGELASLELVRSSGNPDMDKSLVGAIRGAQPFPPFPENIKAGSMEIRANFIVADLPTAPVRVASQSAASEPVTAPKLTTESSKKYRWGLPAGTAHKKQEKEQLKPTAPPAPITTPSRPDQNTPAAKKYRWGR